jgi:hypothetical protein
VLNATFVRRGAAHRVSRQKIVKSLGAWPLNAYFLSASLQSSVFGSECPGWKSAEKLKL